MLLQRLTALFLLCLSLLFVSGCGGGGGSGNDCERTGTLDFVYTPAVRTDGNDALTYKLGQINTWTLQIKGVTPACLTGLKVSVPSGRPALPAGFTLDAATGTISTGVLNQPVEGECLEGGTWHGASVNRVCGAGLTLQDTRYVLWIQTDRVNAEATPVNTPITFQPAS